MLPYNVMKVWAGWKWLNCIPDCECTWCGDRAHPLRLPPRLACTSGWWPRWSTPISVTDHLAISLQCMTSQMPVNLPLNKTPNTFLKSHSSLGSPTSAKVLQCRIEMLIDTMLSLDKQLCSLLALILRNKTKDLHRSGSCPSIWWCPFFWLHYQRCQSIDKKKKIMKAEPYFI